MPWSLRTRESRTVVMARIWSTVSLGDPSLPSADVLLVKQFFEGGEKEMVKHPYYVCVDFLVVFPSLFRTWGQEKQFVQFRALKLLETRGQVLPLELRPSLVSHLGGT